MYRGHMNHHPNQNLPSRGFQFEAEHFFETLENNSPDSFTSCFGWTAHEVVAHLTAASLEIALNLEAYGAGEPVPTTRSFEEREAPFRQMDDPLLRCELTKSISRMSKALDAVLMSEPDAVVPWTGRQMVVKTFVTHLRSEFAIHRFDLVGDDDIGNELLAQPELTLHAVTVLGKPLLQRGSKSQISPCHAVIGSPGTSDVMVIVDDQGTRMLVSEEASEPSVIGDPAARLLFLWGRRPSDPSRLSAPAGSKVLSDLQKLLAGY